MKHENEMIISVSVFKIYKEYLDFTLHYLAGIIWKWLNIHCPFDLNGKPAGSGPFVGAIGGPCNGHLSLSQVWLVEPLDVEQKNSSPWSEQTWAPSPKKKILSATMLICQCTKPQAVLSKKIVMHLPKKEKSFSIFWLQWQCHVICFLVSLSYSKRPSFPSPSSSSSPSMLLGSVICAEKLFLTSKRENQHAIMGGGGGISFSQCPNWKRFFFGRCFLRLDKYFEYWYLWSGYNQHEPITSHLL